MLLNGSCNLQFPRSWVARSNHQRQGVYVSDFNVRLHAYRDYHQHFQCVP